jgi:hypothetical protein
MRGAGALAAFFLATTPAWASTYDELVLAAQPVAYFPLVLSGDCFADLTVPDRCGRIFPQGKAPLTTTLPNGDAATVFDGATWAEVPSSPELSIPATGSLTVEAWIRPDVLDFANQEGEDFVYWIGKGAPGSFEYAGRMYSLHDRAVPPRPNRIAAYAFNPAGGLGAGAFFQDPLAAGRWIHVAMIFDPLFVRIYRDGVLRGTGDLATYHIVPAAGGSPLSIATRDRNSFFQGAIAKVALYGHALTPEQIRSHCAAMQP